MLDKKNWKQCISFPCSKLDRIEVFADMLEGGSFADCLYCLLTDEFFDKLTVDAFVAKVVFVFPVKFCSVVLSGPGEPPHSNLVVLKKFTFPVLVDMFDPISVVLFCHFVNGELFCRKNNFNMLIFNMNIISQQGS